MAYWRVPPRGSNGLAEQSRTLLAEAKASWIQRIGRPYYEVSVYVLKDDDSSPLPSNTLLMGEKVEAVHELSLFLRPATQSDARVKLVDVVAD